MKKLTKREFDSKYQDFRDWPLETIYIIYSDLFDEVKKEVEYLGGYCDRLREEIDRDKRLK